MARTLPASRQIQEAVVRGQLNRVRDLIAMRVSCRAASDGAAGGQSAVGSSVAPLRTPTRRARPGQLYADNLIRVLRRRFVPNRRHVRWDHHRRPRTRAPTENQSARKRTGGALSDSIHSLDARSLSWP